MTQGAPPPGSGCGCGSAGCGAGRADGRQSAGDGHEPGGFSRRDFLRIAGAGMAAALAGFPAIAFSARDPQTPTHFSHHKIPADKNLAAQWLRSLTEKGSPDIWRGVELKTIGQPIGGIGTGQLYLCGDGTLGNWEIFNRHDFIGSGSECYRPRSIKRPVGQGFAVYVEGREGVAARPLRDTGFDDVEFCGTYPIGTVRYADPGCPLRVELEAFSPYIPLNARDSALPATLFHITIENTSTNHVRTGVMGWLENPVGAEAGRRAWSAHRRTRVVRGAADTRILHSAENDASAVAKVEPTPTPPVRPSLLIADFDGDHYGAWKTEGTAFGSAPTTGTLPFQMPVEGYEGNWFVNSFQGGDDSHGLLRSPVFTIERRFINFKIGGGDKPKDAGMRLLVGGEVVRSATGRDMEKLDWRFWNVEEFEGKSAVIEIFDAASGPWGHVLADRIEQGDIEKCSVYDPSRLEQFADYGTIALSCDAECLSSEEGERLANGLSGLGAELRFLDDESFALDRRVDAALATRPVDLGPGGKKTFLFTLAWHFPNTVRPAIDCGHEYAARFDDASVVVDYILANRERLVGDTRAWRDCYYDSGLPDWLLHRLHLTACCLATGTSMWWKNGRFWAWEGVECCAGTCTHVWNYAQTAARLFPEIERSAREMQDFGEGFDAETGLVGFRGNRDYAADGQCGTILKSWREHLVSPDDAFLRRNWPSIRKALDFLLKQDDNADGLIENTQHNTFDVNFHGANTFVGSLYLAALRAGEEMALELGERDYAHRLRAVFEMGSTLSVERLWNGEFFFQEVDLEKYPRFQYGAGCLSDQVFGQSWAEQVGLGYLYPRENVRKALESVWKYNWSPDVGPYQDRVGPERIYAERTEGGLFTCTWPKSEYLKDGLPYKNELWSGIEYEVASHMIREGMVIEGLAICRAIHDRYHPRKRNPYNEVECGDYYARAMASWGVLLALCGFEYHGPKGRIGFAPRLSPEKFRAPFTAAEGWGTYEQRHEGSNLHATIQVRHGSLRVNRIAVEVPNEGTRPVRAKVGAMIRGLGGDLESAPSSIAETRRAGRRVEIQLAKDVVLAAGETLEVVVEG